jgi:hypothetical protein
MVQNINIKNEASFFDGCNISFQLFIHSTLSILLIQHDKNMKIILEQITPESQIQFDEFLTKLLISPLKVQLASISKSS